MFKFFQNLKIIQRLAGSFGVLLLLMLVLMTVGLWGFYSGTNDLDALEGDDYRKLELADSLVRLFNNNAYTTFEWLFTSDQALRDRSIADIEKARLEIADTMEELSRLVTSVKGKELLSNIVEARKPYKASGDKFMRLMMADKREEAFAMMDKERLPALTNLIQATNALSAHQGLQIKETAERARATFASSRKMMLGLGLLAVALGALLSYLVSRHIINSTTRLVSTVQRVSEGDLSARSNLDTGDELGQLSRAFDGMLNERLAGIAQKEKDSEALNNSIIEIMRSVSRLSRGDLRVLVPVREDVTGALADSINSMTESTVKALAGVNTSSDAMRNESKIGRATVLATAKGMNEVRGTIQETGKRIKRLGERSQEIGGIVKLIDDIAERTSVLALNANMQAAVAGEAGRGFRVVADEVQRLAERSKEATDQIAKLVSTIQGETNDTIATMERAIGEVVKGGELAETAAEQVSNLEKLGNELYESVQTFTLPEGLQASVAPLRRAA